MATNNSNVAHFWANDTRRQGSKRSGHMTSDHGILYSYAAVIGIHLTYKGKGITLLSDRSYSVTTARHQSEMRRAASHLDAITVPDIPSAIKRTDPTSADMKAAARDLFVLWHDRAKDIADKLPRARTNASYLLSNLTGIKKHVDAFAALARVKVPAKLAKILALPESEDWRAILGEQAERVRKREADRKRKQTADNARAIQIWQAFSVPADGERVTYEKVDRDYLRYNNQTDRVETTQRVEVPVRLARDLYDWLKVTRANGGCNSEAECNYRLLNMYNVRAVNDQYFEIGCHTIYFDQVEYIANLLGWDRVAYLTHEQQPQV